MSSSSSSVLLNSQMAVPPLPALTPLQQALSATRFSSWYPPLRRVSPMATIVDVTALQPDFYEWLQEDGLMIPRGSGAGVIGEDEEDEKEDMTEEDEKEDMTEEEEDDVAPPLQARDFSRLNEHIRAIIKLYNGEVFPKMDWSAPRDAAWILPGQTLRCTTPADVYLLLKSSDFVAKDVEQAKEMVDFHKKRHSDQHSLPSAASPASHLEGQVASLSLTTADSPNHASSERSTSWHLNLILKRHFASLSPSHEFRCFVRAGCFVAACQRDERTFYDFLQNPAVKLEIRTKLRDFWVAYLKDKLLLGCDGAIVADTGEDHEELSAVLQDYVWDVYLTRDRSKVFLIDVNAYAPRTDALLWDWDELEQKADRAWRRAHGQDITRLDVAAGSSDQNGDENDAPAKNAALFGDEDQRLHDESEGEDSDKDEEEDESNLRGEAFVRIYTDGRPPTTHYEPWPIAVGQSEASSPAGGTRRPTSSIAYPARIRHRYPLPTLRLLTSQMQAQCAIGGAPAYVANMAPKEAVDIGSGTSIEEFARAWQSQRGA